jgi:predicted nucleic acid-binding protein
MIFVDTSAWFAAFVKDDVRHLPAKHWLESDHGPLVTTDYVIDELLTLMMARQNKRRAEIAGKVLLEGALAEIEWTTKADFQAAWDVFRVYSDKQWSFTDCVSRVVMQRLSVKTAFAFDDHFAQFGTVNIVP